jgi:hypothetical protein
LNDAREQGRELRGPAPASPDRGKIFTVAAFDVHVEERYAICPAPQVADDMARGNVSRRSAARLLVSALWARRLRVGV